jgi:IS30 family transposase
MGGSTPGAAEAPSGASQPRSTVQNESVERTGGMSLRAIAVAFGVSATTVHRDVRRESHYDDDGRLLVPLVLGLDGKVRPAVRFDTSGRDELIRQRRATGTPMRTIAAEIGCSVGTVHRVLKGKASRR